MKEVSFRIVRSDGREFLIDNKDWMIESGGLENWCTQNIEVSSEEAANVDGGFLQGVRMKSIDRSITARIADERYNEEMRESLISFFSPRFNYVVHVTYQDRTLWCEGAQLGFKCSTGNVYQPIMFSWTILCTNPFLMSEDDFAKDVATINPKFGFPLQSLLPTGTSVNGLVQPKCMAGFICGAYAFQENVRIFNDGDVETCLRAVIEAGGDVKNPAIYKDGKFVKVLTTLHEGQVLDIDFTQRPPTVKIDGKNSIHLCDRASNFTSMDVQLGENIFSYNADSGQPNMSVTLYWFKRYLGV